MLCGGVSLCAETAEKPYFKRFSGIEKIHRNSIKITVDLCVITTALIQFNFPSAFEPTGFINGFI